MDFFSIFLFIIICEGHFFRKFYTGNDPRKINIV